MSQFSSIATCFGHVVLAAVTGWSLKYLPAPNLLSTPFVWIMLWCLMAYSMLGIIRFSHPQPGKLLRFLYDHTALLAKVCPLPFLNAQLYLAQPAQTLHEFGESFVQPYQNGLGYAFLLSAVVAYVVCNIFSDLSRRHIGEHVATGVLLLNAVGLSLVACSSDNFWAMGLVVSCVSKHFLLPVLAERYRMPHALLYTYGLSFYEIFAVNAVIDVQTSTIRVIM
ncbi:uncharacterized protein LOC118503981 [Anopheles stephensi]|uniref:Uncharacterized protein n=1 Tax=Anopheles stephensi TaxID=30069 RepID=A0A182Y4S9_ANOST|nr:uncharacterized protein LOC118503981 [Anopheles stephensi]XP_035893831.1 uncharacterized protein LOC118503981 [Anopheles stephensi]